MSEQPPFYGSSSTKSLDIQIVTGKKCLLVLAALLGVTAIEVVDLLRDVPLDRLRSELAVYQPIENDPAPAAIRIVLACASLDVLHNEIERRSMDG